MASITLITRDGDWTGVITMRPDGHLSGGTKQGAEATNENKQLTIDAVAEVFRLAELTADVPTGRGGADRTVTLTINKDGGKRLQYAWPTEVRPTDARLLGLLVAIETIRDRELGTTLRGGRG